MNKMGRLMGTALMAVFVMAGCGRSHMVEQQLEQAAQDYTRAVVERRLDDARKMLTGEALQAAEIAFPVLLAMDLQQKLLEIEAEAEPVGRDENRASVTVRYRVETDAPGFGTTTERVTTLYDFIRLGDQWRIYRVSVLDSAKEGAK